MSTLIIHFVNKKCIFQKIWDLQFTYFLFIISSEFVSFWGVTRGRGSKTKDDKVRHGGREVRSIEF